MGRSYIQGNSHRLLLPVYGCFLFVLFYILAALNYPGGSGAHTTAKGFDWLNNYWCNLLAQRAVNGSINDGRPFAFAGMIILCLSLSMFWIQTGRDQELARSWKIVVPVCGVSSMFVSAFLFTEWHDAVINIAGVLGLAAMFGLFKSLYRKGWLLLFTLGWINLFLILMNNVLYYGHYFLYLPFVQKISFLSFLCWISMISVKRWQEN